MKKPLRPVSPANVKIFKIANRRGYAALCLNNLTEGTTAYLAYQRMIKALRRSGYALAVVPHSRLQRLIRACV